MLSQTKARSLTYSYKGISDVKSESERLPLSRLPVLDNAWPFVPLGELCRLVNGDAYRESDWTTKGVPIIRIQNLNNAAKPFKHWAGPTDKLVNVKDGDLLLAWSSTPGTSFGAHFWERGPGLLNQHIFRVDLDRERLCPEWARFSINHGLEDLIAKAHGAVGLRHVTKRECEAIPIPLPPLAEQRRLAAQLRGQLAAVAEARAALQAQLKAAAALPAAYLREVFESTAAQAWPSIAIREVAQMLPAASISTAGDTTIRVITSACLSESGFSPLGIKTATMKKSDATRAIVTPGEILIARSNTAELVGRCAVAPAGLENIAASDLTIRLFPDARLDASFACRYLAYLQLTGYWKEKAGGASDTMKKITRGQLNDLPIPLPSLPEQRAIAARLDESFARVATLRAGLEARLAAVERLPAALLRKVFE